VYWTSILLIKTSGGSVRVESPAIISYIVSGYRLFIGLGL
jgi:hypothetical protein